MSCGSQWLVLLPPQQHIQRPRLEFEAYVVANHSLIGRRSQPRMTKNSATSRPLECSTFLLICLRSLNELWITMGDLASSSTTHSKPKAKDGSLCGHKTFSDCQVLPAKNDIGCSHAKAPVVVSNSAQSMRDDLVSTSTSHLILMRLVSDMVPQQSVFRSPG